MERENIEDSTRRSEQSDHFHVLDANQEASPHRNIQQQEMKVTSSQVSPKATMSSMDALSCPKRPAPMEDIDSYGCFADREAVRPSIYLPELDTKFANESAEPQIALRPKRARYSFEQVYSTHWEFCSVPDQPTRSLGCAHLLSQTVTPLRRENDDSSLSSQDPACHRYLPNMNELPGEWDCPINLRDEGRLAVKPRFSVVHDFAAERKLFLPLDL